MSHVKGLGYSEQPNYVFLRQLLIGAMARLNLNIISKTDVIDS